MLLIWFVDVPENFLFPFFLFFKLKTYLKCLEAVHELSAK